MFAITGVLRLLGTLLELLGACLRPRTALAAENLFLRRQLGLYTERNVKARRPDRVTRFALAYLSKFWLNAESCGYFWGAHCLQNEVGCGIARGCAPC
jgi:hypothetical protein